MGDDPAEHPRSIPEAVARSCPILDVHDVKQQKLVARTACAVHAISSELTLLWAILPLLPVRRRVWPCAVSYSGLVLRPIVSCSGVFVWMTGEQPWLITHPRSQSLAGRLNGRAAVVAVARYERKRRMKCHIYDLASERKTLTIFYQ
jgi:hypothetical protein